MPTSDTNLMHVDTTPGSNHIFASPADLAGDAEAYATWLRGKYDHDPGMRQYIILLSRLVCGRSTIQLDRPVIEGPFASRLILACKNLDAWLHQPNQHAA